MNYTLPHVRHIDFDAMAGDLTPWHVDQFWYKPPIIVQALWLLVASWDLCHEQIRELSIPKSNIKLHKNKLKKKKWTALLLSKHLCTKGRALWPPHGTKFFLTNSFATLEDCDAGCDHPNLISALPTSLLPLLSSQPWSQSLKLASQNTT